MTQFTDQDLTAFLDGEADAEMSCAIQSALAEDGALSERLAELHMDKDALRAAFDEVLTTAPPAPALPEPAPIAGSMRDRSGWFKMAAAILLAVGVGWAVGQAGRSDLEDWQDYAAAYHRLYVEETLQMTDFSEQALQEQLTSVGDAIGSELSLKDIAGFDGLELRRAQVLGYGGSKIAHIALQNAAGEPVALCIMASSDAADLEIAQAFGMVTARWGTGAHAYYLIGGSDEGLIERAASHFESL